MIYKNAMITTKDEQFLGFLEINNEGKIIKIVDGTTEKEGFDCQGQIIMPSFIDSHTHGGYNFSFNDLAYENIADKLKNYQKNLVSEGVSHVVPTIVTDTWKNIEKIIKNYQKIDKEYLAYFLSFYLEGPFISPIKKGAHNSDLLIGLDDEKLTFLKENFSKEKVIIAVAPEEKKNFQFIEKYSADLLFSVGHSNAYGLSKNNFFNKHIKRVVHLFNACSTFDHRDESIVNTIFESEKIEKDFAIEIIGDTFHVRDQVLKFLYKSLGANNLTIISDSLPQKGLKNGNYNLGSLEIIKVDDLFYLSDHKTLAGSGMPYNKILKNFYRATQASWPDMVKMSSYNAAKNLKAEQSLGILKEDTLANFVLINEQFEVKLLYKDGKIVFKNKGCKLNEN
ncbi:amidohydrolase family protein [Mycoplasma iguanae]|uniref:Amidohydrolase family protein n=1 Tax=Mycoplasma iguanae TaxID=292461 RepID=A0ABY5R9A9_9MOLU|nr:amidohydrolase family protein [Mycoplasma iguanae]UVD81911.1 amidohydrolase family protein [Mycoplasma iguanae]